MKCIFALMVILVTTTISAKDIPTPFWYSITQKILSETQDYILSTDVLADESKSKLRKNRGHLSAPLFCDQKKDLVQLPFLKLKSDPLFSVVE